MSIADNMATMAAGGPAKAAPKPDHEMGGEQHGLGHELMKQAHEKEPMGKHTHIHHRDDGTHTSHHVDENGKESGPHEHGSDEEMKAHLDKFTHGGEGDEEGSSDNSGSDCLM